MPMILHYFDIYGRGEPIRVILHYAGIQFEDRTYSFEAWPSIQNSFEFSELPCLEIDGIRLVQSQSIARYLCIRLGYYHKDPYLNYLSSSLVDGIKDFLDKKIEMVWVLKNFEGFVEWVKNEYVVQLKAFEKRYVLNGETGFFVGNYPTIGDFHVFVFIYDQFIRESVRDKMLFILLENTPKLIEFCDSFRKTSLTLDKYWNTRPVKAF